MERQAKKTNTTRRRHKIYIQVKSSVSDGRGGYTETWADNMGPIWASVDPLRASKVVEYRSTNVHATHLIGISARFAVTEFNRIRFGTRIFEIVASEDLQERHIDLVITANEVRA